ncbi:putative helicase [Pseudomonas phage OBP]|uniref:DNA helicase n=1 Tax=Pseudomonas phage OBP TaxID=1124849 RepID=UPI000240D432|nr:DNA helicase [Pseudomonas phage OBP]AEV89521.1 putative helicase [Pseudomonas phage OBP]
MRRTLVIHKGHSYVRLTDYKPELMQQILLPFCKRNFYRVQKTPVPGGGPNAIKWEVSHVFARFNNDKTELRFNAEKLPDLLKMMEENGYNKSRILIETEPEIEGANAVIKLKDPKIKPRNELQEDYCQFMLGPKPVVVNNATTGFGKSFMAIWTAYMLQKRTLITVLPRYVDIWVKTIAEFLNVHPTDILVADTFGIEKLHQIMKDGLVNPSFIILPLTKIDVYIKRMKEDSSLPGLDEVFTDLNCGYRIIDEAHESIYSVYMSMMFGNHKKTAALSATLSGDDDFVNGIYSQIFPHHAYLRPPEYTKYIHVIAYTHRIDVNRYRIQAKGFGGYSHVKFEQAVMKSSHVWEQYYQMLKEAFVTYYLDTYREGQKAMWFFQTVEMCDLFLKRLKKDYPDLDAITFTAEQSAKKETKSAYREHRVVITTPGSCGTGKDIPQLYIVFSPVSVSSSQRNDQMVGRTRPIDKWWPDLDPIFLYFVCPDIAKQVDYHRKRKQIFDKKMKKFTLIDSGSRI